MTKDIILSKEDYELLSRFIKNNSFADNYTARKLALELETAKVVEKEKLPADVVGLHSRITLRMEGETRETTVTLVMPNEADIKKGRISIFAPLGSAMIGYQKGDKISWKVPAGIKTFEILDVQHEPEE